MKYKPYAKRIPQAEWNKYKTKIASLLPHRTYTQIVAYLWDEFRFEVTESQLGTQLQKRWKLEKYTKSHLKVKANAKLEEREGRPTEILIKNRRYTTKQVRKTATAVASAQKRKAEENTPGQSTPKQSSGKRPKRTSTKAKNIAEWDQGPDSPNSIIVRTPPSLEVSVASPSNKENLVRADFPQTTIDVFNPWFQQKIIYPAETTVIPLFDTAAMYEQQPVSQQPYDWAELDRTNSRKSESALGMGLGSDTLNFASPTFLTLRSLITRLTQEGYIEHSNKFPSIFKFTESFQLLGSLVYLGSNNLLPEMAVDMLLDWISTHQLLWIIGCLIDSQFPSAVIFCSQLFNRAVAVGDTDTAPYILLKGFDPNLQGNFSFYRGTIYSQERASPLQAAIKNQDAAMVRILLASGAKVNNLTVVNETAGRRVVRTDIDVASDKSRICPIIMELLLLHGANVNVPIQQYHGSTTVLNRVLELNDIEVVKMLLSAGAWVNDHQCGQSVSAIQIASRHCNKDMVQLIIDAGADVNIPIGSEYSRALVVAKGTSNHKFIVTPLQYAAKRDDITVANALLAANALVDGFDFNTFLPRGYNKSGPGDSWDNVEDSDLDAFKEYMEDRNTDDKDDITALMEDLSLYSPLQAAAANKNLAMVQLLLEHHSTINMMGGLGTALQVACMQQTNMEIVKLLIEKGADVNSPAHDRYGRTALQAAILSGDVQTAEYLLEKDADIQAPASSVLGRTALQAAVKMGYNQLASELISRGASVNEATSMYGETSLHLAARSGNMELVCLLLKHKAHVNEPSQTRAWNTSILFQAISSGKHEIVEKIIASGADMTRQRLRRANHGLISAAVQHCNRETVELLLQKRASPNKKNGNGCRPLEHAIERGSLEMVQLLLDFGANPNIRTSCQSCLLADAIFRNDEDLVRMLIANGAKVNPELDYVGGLPLTTAIKIGNFSILRMLVAGKVDAHGQYGIDGLMEAIRTDRTDMVQFLLSLGLTAKHIDVDACFPQCPLAKAIMKDNQEMIDVLLDHDTGFYFRDLQALTAAVERGDLLLIKRLLGLATDAVDHRAYDRALDRAVWTENIDVVETLITAGADVNASSNNHDYCTIFNRAIGNGSLTMVRLFLRKGAHVNPSHIHQYDGHTPLQCAVRTGNVAIVKLLLSHGADVNAPAAKTNGWTALEAAAEMGRLDLVHMMLQLDKEPSALKLRIQSAAGVATWNGHHLVARFLEEWLQNRNGETKDS